MDADAFEGSQITTVVLDDTKDVVKKVLYNKNMLRQRTPTIQSLALWGCYSNFRFPDNILKHAEVLKELHLRARGVEYNCRLFKGLK